MSMFGSLARAVFTSDEEGVDFTSVDSGMADFDQIFSGPVPDQVWHYTDFNGLDGIVTTGTIWATSVHHMNDQGELQHAMQLWRDRLTVEQARNPHTRFAEFIKTPIPPPAPDIWKHRFIACFTENANRLSQWRTYGTIQIVSVLPLQAHICGFWQLVLLVWRSRAMKTALSNQPSFWAG